jgi:PST family polysaccharide transporter
MLGAPDTGPFTRTLTSTRSLLAAFAIILIDLLGRAGLDKVLALAAGPAVVALWAQLQSVVDLVSGVVTTGVLSGLTVTVSQARGPEEERALLSLGLRLALLTAGSAALAMALSSPLVSAWLTEGRILPRLVVLAALAGCFAALPAALNAYWLGKQWQPRMLGLSLLLALVWAAVAASAWRGLSLSGLALTQALALLLIAAAVWRHLKSLQQPGAAAELPRAALRELASRLRNYIPVGLAIGIMSPASMLLIRGLLAGALGWMDVGYLQALWRVSEWVTSAAAGVLSLVFLPRLSASWRTPRFGAELARSARWVLLAAAALLGLLYFNQHAILALLYDAQFRVSNTTAALFLLGCWVRVGSWVFLNGLFATHSTRAIIIGEVLSLPLLALLLRLNAHGMTLERTAGLYLAVYCVYLAFNAAALMLARPATAHSR